MVEFKARRRSQRMLKITVHHQSTLIFLWKRGNVDGMPAKAETSETNTGTETTRTANWLIGWLIGV